MKTVLLLRHAKSDWGSPDLADFDRPLANRGIKDAPKMGEVLLDADCVPEIILSSPARRAKETSQLVAKACGYKKPIQWEADFYGGGSQDLIEALKQLPNTIERAMLVGHNPTMEETAAALLFSHKAGWNDDLAIRMPTAALLCLDIAIMEWAALEPGDAVLRWFLIPKLAHAIL